jgi:hypothetical protein
VRPSGSLGALDVLVVEEDGNTLLNGDCAVIVRLQEKARIRSKKVLENENEDEDMMFSSLKRHGRTQSFAARSEFHCIEMSYGNLDAGIRS